MAAETGSVWPDSSESGPRCAAGLEVDELGWLSLRRLEGALGMRCSGADGAEDFWVVQRPTVWSLEAERMREDGAWTAMESMLDL